MASQSDDEREALANEARRLREAREAKARTEHESRIATKASHAQAVERGAGWRLRKSVARPWTLWGALFGLLLASMMLLGWSVEDRSPLIAGSLGLAILVGFVSYFASGLARWRWWRRRMPFAITNDEHVLSLPEAVEIAIVTIKFRDAAIPDDQLHELLQAHVPGSQHTIDDAMVSIRSVELEVEDANWRVANWFRALAHSVLAKVHRGYPIESVSIIAAKTREFYVPSGD